MRPGQRGTVAGLTNSGPIARRLVELGIAPGRSIHYVRCAPLHDPMEIRVGHCHISLRRAEASLVTVDVESK
ncbi:MAG: ferrous iron transport protein A [Candidatus Zixiibacteriota bacterium]